MVWAVPPAYDAATMTKSASILKFSLAPLTWTLVVGSTLAADATYTNPVLPGDFPDPSIIRSGQEFWATATSSEWGPQFPLLRSSDLVNWEQVGAVFPHRPAWASANFWAPEISEYNG